ncbi:MAG TPA: hypothetical protein DCY13_14310 [Verrucomicrobiales bacterium]|nr:hypothetical protein [Verrucomicrobiales bacterium]
MERLAYVILGTLAGIWLVLMIAGMVVAWPVGILGLLGMFAVGLLLVKVLKERMSNKEDDHYDKNVEK